MSASDSATITASTKRPPALSGGKVGSPATHLRSVAILPLLPASQELALEGQLRSAREGKMTFAFADGDNELPDILEGDLLVVSGVEYPVKMVKEWERPETGSYLEILVTRKVS